VGLWQVLKTGGGAQNVANIGKLVDYAAGKLLLIRDTFPHYTLHDRQHAENLVKIMDTLLRDDIDKVTPIEAAMLILAAYFHDIGMVYHPDEIVEIVEEEDFKDYLDANPAAYVRVHQSAGGVIPQEVILDYCRARHAARVGEHLHQVQPGLLTWDGVVIADALATLCRNHNEPRAHLRSESFQTAFLGSCDMRLCAILLRLADILDFDRTRTPAAVYDHLGLATASDGLRAVSNTEWSKHLASSGFRFPAQRPPNYSITALASPKRPAVEHAIRKFLDVVEDELRGCRILLDFCDQRWRSLALPGGIDRQGIVSDGYQYGEYQFSLDRHAVLRLFMGDKLYADPYVFIRELLQNAIDACRLACYLHDTDPATMEVRVSAWEDDAGYFWLRVDDTGTGMDQDIVEKYFLGVGRSYYSSDELQADLLHKNKPKQDFTAISRFGIGVLSSFIVGDRIEVSTRRRRPDGRLADPLRLSLDSIEDFFVLQEYPKHKANLIPSRHGQEDGYRKRAGTSVAVRIDPTKSDVTVAELLDRAKNYLHFPPVPIFINDIEQKDQALARLDKPLMDAPTRRRLTHSHSISKEPYDLLATTELSIVAIPLNLTASSPSPAVRGQLVTIAADATRPISLVHALPPHARGQLSDDLVQALGNCIVSYDVKLSRTGGKVSIVLRLECSTQVLREVDKQLQSSFFGAMVKKGEEVAVLYEHYRIGLSSFVDDVDFDILEKHWLGHNGVAVSTSLELTSTEDSERLELVSMDSSGRGDLLMFGPVCLFDNLRPEVSVSRDTLRDVPFHIRSALQLAIRRAAAMYDGTPEQTATEKIGMRDLLTDLQLGKVTHAQIEGDPLASEWKSEQIIELPNGERCSTEEVRQLAKHQLIHFEVSRPWLEFSGYSFYDSLNLAMVELELDIEILNTQRPFTRRRDVTVYNANRPVQPSGLCTLPPFTVVRYDTADVLIRPGYPANLRHPIAAWFAEHAAALSADYPAFFAQLMRAFAEINALDIRSETEADDVVELLNATLDRIRRSWPNPPRELFTEVYADSECQLRTRG